MSRGSACRRQRPFTVREWIRVYTDREPPLPAALLQQPVNTTPRRQLRRVVQWLRSIGAPGGSPENA